MQAQAVKFLLQTLRLVKYLCGKGSSDFKRGFSKHASSVRCSDTKR